MLSGAVDIEVDIEFDDEVFVDIDSREVWHAPENKPFIHALGHPPRQACSSLKHGALAFIICIGCIAAFSVFVAHPAKRGAEMKGDHRREAVIFSHIPLIQAPAGQEAPTAQAPPVPYTPTVSFTSTSTTTTTSTSSSYWWPSVTTHWSYPPITTTTSSYWWYPPVTSTATWYPTSTGVHRRAILSEPTTSTTSTTSTTVPSTTNMTLAVSTNSTNSTNSTSSTNSTNTTSTNIMTTTSPLPPPPPPPPPYPPPPLPSLRPAIAEDRHEIQAQALAMPSLFCWSYVNQHGPEWDILLQQHAGKLSIFRCNHWNVFTLEPAQLSAEFTTTAIYGPPAKFYSHSWGAIIENTDVFLRVWEHIIAAGLHKHDQWTVKVDVDTVFFPQRLRDHLQCKGNPWQTAAFLRNCQSFQSMQGPLEIISQAAIDATASMQICRHAAVNLKQEDQFMAHCMEKIGAVGVEAYGLLADQYCDGAAKGLTVVWPDHAGAICQCDGVNASIAAIHPCKNADSWQTCWSQLVRRSDPSSICSPSQLAPAATPLSQDASAVAPQESAAALNDAAVSQNAAAFSHDVEGINLIPMAR